jgi:hypothetical protein
LKTELVNLKQVTTDPWDFLWWGIPHN